MPIAYDAGSYIGGNSSATLTLSHTIGGGTDRMLVVGLLSHNSTAVFVNSVEYNGTGMRFLQFKTAASSRLLSMLWCQYDASLPAAGTYNIVASFDRVIDRGCMLFATSWSGMRQITPIWNYDENTAADTTLSGACTTAAVSSRVIQICGNDALQTPTASGTDNQVIISGNQATLIGGSMNRISSTTVGPKTFAMNVAVAANLCMCYSEFLPSDAPQILLDRPFSRGVNPIFNKGIGQLG